MKRPWLLQLLPDRIRLSVWARYYRRHDNRWNALYGKSELKYAPGVYMELVPGDVISDSIAFTGIHELVLTKRVAQLAKTGGTLIDVGANLGYFTLLWLSANPENRCIAFEASPRNVALLRKNIITNGFQDRVQVISQGAGKSAGTLRFDPGPPEQTGWGGFTVNPEGIEVDVVRVDDIVPVNLQVALMKVDIEGADTWALMGSERLLQAKSIKKVWFEQNKPRMLALGLPVNAAQDYLTSIGYRCSPMSNPSSNLVDWSAEAE